MKNQTLKWNQKIILAMLPWLFHILQVLRAPKDFVPTPLVCNTEAFRK